jgi:hypothetical protein
VASGRKMVLPSGATMQARIVDAVTLCNPAELAEGVKWYGEAREYARTLAAGTPFTWEQVCGVLAALSPQVSWAQNKDWARMIVEAKAKWAYEIPAVSTGNNRAKAWRCLDSGVNPTSVIRGPKVTAFYANMIGDHAYVTVDVWAFYVATGIKLRQNQSVPKWAYPLVVQAYKNAAAELGIEPDECQAAAWGSVVGRGSYH